MLTMRDILMRTLDIRVRPLLDGIGHEVIIDGKKSVEKRDLTEAIGEAVYQMTKFYHDPRELRHPIEMECDPVVFCHKCDIADATHFSLCDEHQKSVGPDGDV
jgi:hypothetical protein